MFNKSKDKEIQKLEEALATANDHILLLVEVIKFYEVAINGYKGLCKISTDKLVEVVAVLKALQDENTRLRVRNN